MNRDIRELVALIPEWLVVTRGRSISTGLSREEALRRAAAMRGLLRDGRIEPENVILDDELKDVFYALVALVTEVEPGTEAALALEASAVYQFLDRVEWLDDLFEEKHSLLCSLADAGWRAMGSSVDEVTRRRLSTDGAAIHHGKTDPEGEDHLDGLEASRLAQQFLAVPRDERTGDYKDRTLSRPDVLFAICGVLRGQRDVVPANIASEASSLYLWLLQAGDKVGFFDERDYLLGESAFLAGGAYRVLGRREECLRWLDRADAGFRHTVNPAPGLSNVSYGRLALRYELGECDDVLDLVPSLRKSFEKLGMEAEATKCRLLQAMTLKLCGRRGEAIAALEPGTSKKATGGDPALAARILAELGDLHQLEGRIEEAIQLYRQASRLLEKSGVCVASADLKMFLGGAYAVQGQFASALEAARCALADYATLGMLTRVAYLRLVAADTLLHLDRPREAEWEILQALPTIEEQKMVPEGFAAVALLRESVKRRKADPNALRELREHLQKQN